jgi:F-type H+-transporting ATPase subunit b
MLALDASLVYQIVLFVALWLILKRLWFDPAMAVVKERARRSEGALAEARTVREEAERMRREHAAALAEARAEAQREVQEIMRAAEQEQRRLVDEANASAQKTLTEVRARVAEDVDAARQSLRADVDAIARQIAHAVLGRAV